MNRVWNEYEQRFEQIQNRLNSWQRWKKYKGRRIQEGIVQEFVFLVINIQVSYIKVGQQLYYVYINKIYIQQILFNQIIQYIHIFNFFIYNFIYLLNICILLKPSMKKNINPHLPILRTKKIHKNLKNTKSTKNSISQIIIPNTNIPPFNHQQYHHSSIISQNQIPYSHLVFSKKVNKQKIINHAFQAYFGVNYGINMRSLTHQELEKYKFKLPTQKTKKMTLFLDLDETLVHTCIKFEQNNKFDHRIQIQYNGIFQKACFNLRPFCLNFLENISKVYQIYIFTASCDEYARGMMNFLNKNFRSISGYLSRQFCLKTSSGVYIKDLSRIQNRNLNEMVIVDNLAYSFGNLIQNGIPILQFRDDKEDEQLIYLENYLIQGSKQEDIREYNRGQLKLRQIIKFREYFQR